MSPGSDGMFVPANTKAKATQKPRKKPTSNAQGKSLAKEKALGVENEARKEATMGLTIPPSKKVCFKWAAWVVYKLSPWPTHPPSP